MRIRFILKEIIEIGDLVAAAYDRMGTVRYQRMGMIYLGWNGVHRFMGPDGIVEGFPADTGPQDLMILDIISKFSDVE